MDNAADNGKCLELLQRSFASIDPLSDRIRCICHVINLVVRALLFGEDVSEWEKRLIDASEEQRAALWSLRGIIGKLHNLVSYINRNDARREVLRVRMRATKTSDGKLFIGVLLSGGGVRWNATYYMIERALNCRPAIDLYQAQWKAPQKNDKHIRRTFSPILTGTSLSSFIPSCNPSSGSQSDCKAEQMGRETRVAKALCGKFSTLWTSCLRSSRVSKKRLTSWMQRVTTPSSLLLRWRARCMVKD